MIRRNTRRAFTLIELLLVMVILAVLAAVVVPKFVNRGDDARISATKSTIANLRSCLATFEIDNGRFPKNEEGLSVLIERPADLANSWKGPYVEGGKVPLDGWGHELQYKWPSDVEENGYDIISMGKDGVIGTEDDITNHQ